MNPDPNRFQTFVTNGANIGTFQLNYGADVNIQWYMEFYVTSTATANDADVYRVYGKYRSI